MKNGKKILFKTLKILGKILGVLLVLILLIILFIRSPWGQDVITTRATAYVSDKTGTKVEIDKLFITFDGNILLDGLFLEDIKGDTLVYSKHLEADVPLWPIIKGGAIGVDNLEWNGVRGNVYRKDSLNGFNYQFLIDAFASADTTATTPTDTSGIDLQLGRFDLADIKLKFDDEVGGMHAGVNLGTLILEMDETDLNTMRFEVDEASIQNTSIAYKLDKPQPQSEPSESPLPTIVVNQLILDKFSLNYESVPDGLLANAVIDQFSLEMPLANLTENKIDVEKIALKNSSFRVERKVNVSDSVNIKNADSTQTSAPFEWPEFNINVGAIDFAENQLEYYVNGAQPKENIFNADALKISNLRLQAENISYKEKQADLRLNNFTFSEASGIDLTILAFALSANDTHFGINDLQVNLNQNELQGKAQLDYASVQQLIDYPENATMALDINSIQANVGSAFVFQPELKKNEYLRALAQKPVMGRFKASGKLASINIPIFDLNWGQSTRISASGKVYNAMDTEKLRYDFPKINIALAKNDLVKFVNEDSLGVALPQKINLKANVKGTTTQVDALADLTTVDGSFHLDGNADFGDAIAFNGSLKVKELNLGKILKNEQMGALTLDIETQGSGSTINSLDAQLDATVVNFGLNGYAIEDLNINGAIKNGVGDVKSAYKDENLDMALNAHVDLDTVASKAKLNLDVKGADLLALGLTSRNVKTALKLEADFNGDAENFQASSQITEGVAVYDNKSYLFGDLNLKAFVKPDTTSLDVTNRILELHLESNTDPATFSEALQRHINTYLTDVPRTDTVSKPVKLKIRGRINQAPILKEVFVANLNQLDTVNIQVDFDERKRSLKANVSAPFIDYNGYQLDSLAFSVNSDKEALNFDFGLREIIAGPINIKSTTLTGRAADKKLDLDFTSYDDADKLVHIMPSIARENGDLQIKIDPSELILNKNSWKIDPNNKIILAEALTRFENFVLTRNDQQLTVSNTIQGIDADHIGVDFKNFRLSSVLSYLNPDENLANGSLNGNFVIENPTKSPGLLADLKISDFKLINVEMGTLALNANSQNGSTYDFGLNIKGGAADLDLTGNYVADPEAAKLNLDLALNEVKMKTLEAFSFGELKEADGSLSGNIKVNGTTVDPIYDGSIVFNTAGFTVTKLNTGFLLEQETLKLDNDGLYFDNFSIKDPENNAFIVDGTVGTEDLLNPNFDLSFKADDFHVLNSTKEDFDMVYGTASFDVDAKLTGNLNIPKVDLDLTVGNDTNIIYTLPASQAQIESMDGVVIFVDKENPDAILTQTEEDSYVLSGVDVNARLKVNKEAVFKIVIDENTGDNFQVQGDADLDFTMNPNGRMTLTGAFEVQDGHYEMSLYNLVKRRFNIAEGSRVVWSGDPFNADLDVRAYYNVETAASPLMAAQTAGLSAGQQNQFRNDLDFLVYLNINGELLQPLITFNLDMPKDDQGAVGGQVYSRVQQLNQQENELNKQVFSLLVLNKFFPDTGSDGSGGGTASIARDNINDAISDQLNTFSDKLLGNSGVQLDFGLDSYTDYQSDGGSQDRTTLDVAAQKKLLDDRLIVRVGSEVDIEGSPSATDGPTPVIGNVSLEYLLTQDGRFRLKGFRRNEFENVIDGQLIVSGISLIFAREFNKFDELWSSMFNLKEDKEEPKDEN